MSQQPAICRKSDSRPSGNRRCVNYMFFALYETVEIVNKPSPDGSRRAQLACTGTGWTMRFHPAFPCSLRVPIWWELNSWKPTLLVLVERLYFYPASSNQDDCYICKEESTEAEWGVGNLLHVMHPNLVMREKHGSQLHFSFEYLKSPPIGLYERKNTPTCMTGQQQANDLPLNNQHGKQHCRQAPIQYLHFTIQMAYWTFTYWRITCRNDCLLYMRRLSHRLVRWAGLFSHTLSGSSLGIEVFSTQEYDDRVRWLTGHLRLASWGSFPHIDMKCESSFDQNMRNKLNKDRPESQTWGLRRRQRQVWRQGSHDAPENIVRGSKNTVRDMSIARLQR